MNTTAGAEGSNSAWAIREIFDMRRLISISRFFLTVHLMAVSPAVLFAAEPASSLQPSQTSRSLLPVCFEADPRDGEAALVARGLDYLFRVGPTGASLMLEVEDGAEGNGNGSARKMHFEFAGANPKAELQGANPLPGKVNYLIGADRSQWRTHVALYGKARVNGLYPGIDLVYYGNG